MPDFTKLKLPFWMDRGEPGRLRQAAVRFWGLWGGWIAWPARQFDPLVCPEGILNLLAWGWDITRFNGEPLGLFRKRVATAWVNARDAGSVAGFQAIFQRLDIGQVTLRERQPGVDWDVIRIKVTDEQVAQNGELLREIIRQYGRTCRRYEYEVVNDATATLWPGHLPGEYIVYGATLP